MHHYEESPSFCLSEVQLSSGDNFTRFLFCVRDSMFGLIEGERREFAGGMLIVLVEGREIVLAIKEVREVKR